MGVFGCLDCDFSRADCARFVLWFVLCVLDLSAFGCIIFCLFVAFSYFWLLWLSF